MSRKPHPTDEPLRERLADLPCFWLYLGWRRAQAFYRPFLEEGTNPQRMYVLGLLEEHRDLGVTAIARALGLDVGTTSGLLTRMEREGLIERRRAAENRLEVKIRATRTGRARYRRASAEIEAADRRLLAEIRPQDVESLRRIVETLARLTTAEQHLP